MALRGFSERALGFGGDTRRLLPRFTGMRLPAPAAPSYNYTDLARQIRARRTREETRERQVSDIEARILGPVDPGFIAQAQAKMGGPPATPEERVQRAYEIAGSWERKRAEDRARAQEAADAAQRQEEEEKLLARMSSNRAKDEAKRIELAGKYQGDVAEYRRQYNTLTAEAEWAISQGDYNAAERVIARRNRLAPPTAPTYNRPVYGPRGYVQGYEREPLFGERIEAAPVAPVAPPPAAAPPAAPVAAPTPGVAAGAVAPAPQQTSPAGVQPPAGGLLGQIAAARQAEQARAAAEEAEKQADEMRQSRNQSIRRILGKIEPGMLPEEVQRLIDAQWDIELGPAPPPEDWLAGRVRQVARGEQMVPPPAVPQADPVLMEQLRRAEAARTAGAEISPTGGVWEQTGLPALGATLAEMPGAIFGEQGVLADIGAGRGAEFLMSPAEAVSIPGRVAASELAQAMGLGERASVEQAAADLARLAGPAPEAVQGGGLLAYGPALQAAAGVGEGYSPAEQLAGAQQVADIAAPIAGQLVPGGEQMVRAGFRQLPEQVQVGAARGALELGGGVLEDPLAQAAIIAPTARMLQVADAAVGLAATPGMAVQAGLAAERMREAAQAGDQQAFTQAATEFAGFTGITLAALFGAGADVRARPQPAPGAPPPAPREELLPELELLPEAEGPAIGAPLGPGVQGPVQVSALPETAAAMQPLPSMLTPEVAGAAPTAREAALESAILESLGGAPGAPRLGAAPGRTAEEVLLDQIEAGVRPSPFPRLPIEEAPAAPGMRRTPEEVAEDLALAARAAEEGTTIENLRARDAAAMEADALLAEAGMVPRGTVADVTPGEVPIVPSYAYPEPIGPPAPRRPLTADELEARAMRVAAGIEAPTILGPGGRPVGELVDPGGRQVQAPPRGQPRIEEWLQREHGINPRQWDLMLQDDAQSLVVDGLIRQYNQSIGVGAPRRIPRGLPIRQWANRAYGAGTWERAEEAFRLQGDRTQIDRLRAEHAAHEAGELPTAIAGVEQVPVEDARLTALGEVGAGEARGARPIGQVEQRIRSRQELERAAAQLEVGGPPVPPVPGPRLGPPDMPAHLLGGRSAVTGAGTVSGVSPYEALAAREAAQAHSRGVQATADRYDAALAERAEAVEARTKQLREAGLTEPLPEATVTRDLRPLLTRIKQAIEEANVAGPNQREAIDAARANVDELRVLMDQVRKMDPQSPHVAAMRDVYDQQRAAIRAAEAAFYGSPAPGGRQSYAVSEGPLGEYRIARQGDQWFVTSHLTGKRSHRTMRGGFYKIPYEAEKAVLGPFRNEADAVATAHQFVEAFTNAAERVTPGARYLQDLRRTEGRIAKEWNRRIPESMRGTGTLRQYGQAGLGRGANIRVPGAAATRALPPSDARARTNVRAAAARAEAEAAMRGEEGLGGAEAAAVAQEEAARQARRQAQAEQRAVAEAEAEARAVGQELPMTPQEVQTFADLSDTLEEFAAYLDRPVTDRALRETFAQRKGVPVDQVDQVGKARARAGERGAVDVELLTAPVRAAGEVLRFGTLGPRTVLQRLARVGGAPGAFINRGVQQYRDLVAGLEGRWNQGIREGIRRVSDKSMIQRELENPGKHARTPADIAAVGMVRQVLKDIANAGGDAHRLVGRIKDYFPRYVLEAPEFRETAKRVAREMWNKKGPKGEPGAARRAMEDLGIERADSDEAIDYAASAILFNQFSRYGGIDSHLEIRRTGADVPYATDPNVLFDYVHSAARAIAASNIFDKVDAPVRAAKAGEAAFTPRRTRLGKWKDAWAALEQGGQVPKERLKDYREALERELGFDVPERGSLEAGLSDLQTIYASSKLGLSFLTQMLVLGDVSGIMGLRKLSRGALDVQRNFRQAQDRASRAGSIETPERLAGDVALALREQGITARGDTRATFVDLGRRLVGKDPRRARIREVMEDLPSAYRNAFWMTWMLKTDAAARVVSDASARRMLPDVLEDLAQAPLRADELALTRRGSAEKLMRDVGIDPDQLRQIRPESINALRRGEDPKNRADLTIVDRYARRMVEHTNQRVRAGDLPAWWTSGKGGPIIRFATLFMSFPYRQAQTILRSVATNPRLAARYISQGVPVMAVLGTGIQMAKSVINGYGALGNEERERLPEEDRNFVENAQRLLDGRPIRVQNEGDAYLRLLQGALHGLPKPAALLATEKFTRGRRGGVDVTGLGEVQSQLAAPVAAAFGQPLVEQDPETGEYTEVPRIQAVGRTALGSAAALGVPFVGSQVGREFGVQGSPGQGYFRVRPASSPGLVGRIADLARGETGIQQTLEGIVFGGEGTLSDRRLVLKRIAEREELKRELDALKLETGQKKGKPQKSARQIEREIRKAERELRRLAQRVEARNAGR